MNKERFNQLVKDYSQVDSQYKDLESLVSQYPYSQPVRMLNLKSSSNLTKKDYQQRLALAAFYTTDRNVLRFLIEKGKVPSDFGSRPKKPIKRQVETEKKQAKAVAKADATKPRTKEPTKPITKESKPIDAKHLRDEVMVNLELLQQTKASFLKLAGLDEIKTKSREETVIKKQAAPKKAVAKPAIKTVAAVTKKKAPAVPKSARTKKNELIDKFIADEPSITRGKTLRKNQSDLSKASSELKEDLVSENLAIIFAKQGKASKAIEIYKKLIWKFPQKKASFAARIEELKKK
ncbi:MAG: hypothetical protein DRI71_10300 [Bacteroidetes bacterium]|nr:MAG: hypothetical protein DRI71_10300 [Bacteroidota bacterium]